MKSGRVTWVTLAALPLGLGLNACTSSAGAPSLPASAAVSPPTTGSTASIDGREAVDAYRAMWKDLVVAAQTSDAEHPQLDDHATGDALELLKHMMRDGKAKGVVTKGEPKFAPRVENVRSTTAVISDCADGTAWLRYTETGELENDTPGSHHLVDAKVVRQGGRWLVATLYIDEAGTCLG